MPTASLRRLTRPVRNARISAKILGVVLLTGSVFGAACGIALVGMQDVAARTERLYEHELKRLEVASALRVAVAAGDDALLRDVLSANPGASRGAIEKSDVATEAALKELEATTTDSELISHLTKIRKDRVPLLASRKAIRDELLAGEAVKARSLFERDIQYQAGLVIASVDKLEAGVLADVGAEIQAARKTSQHSKDRMIKLIVFGSLFALVVGYLAARAIANPLRRTVGVLKAVAEGDFTRTLDMDSNDEVGLMAKALDATIGRLRMTLDTIGQTVTALATASDELATVSRSMSDAASRTAGEAGAASTAAAQVSASVESVAAAAEELSMSIREVAAQAANAASVADAGAVRANTASGTVAELGTSSHQIEQVTELITSIAGQTHLLALNATIEAAHAGEVGKGFAVVAQEVKDLARQTESASDDVRRVVGHIQVGSQNAVEAMADVASVIAEVNENQATIAAAVEEQNATTRQIGASAAMAAKGSGEIARNVEAVAGAARDATEGAAQTESAAHELSKMAAGLRGVLSEFRV